MNRLPSLQLVFAVLVCTVSHAADFSLNPAARDIISETCVACHDANSAEGGLNLEQLSDDLIAANTRQLWVLVHDRIAKGEMPPDPDDLENEPRQRLIQQLASSIHDADQTDVMAHGRGPMRRLTRDEYEQNLRQLLQLPHLDIRDMLPADREKYGCNKAADALDVSRVQLAAYLDASDAALRTATASGVAPCDAIRHYLPATRMFLAASTYGEREAMFYAKDSRMIDLKTADLVRMRKENDHDPEIELAIFRSPSWPYYAYPDKFVAAQPGAYHVRFSARAVLQVENYELVPAHASVPMTFRARKRSGPDVSGDVRATGGVLDIQPEVAVYETTVRLKKNETFEYSLLGLPVPRAINPPNAPLYYDFPPMPEGGHPGIAFQWLEVHGPIAPPTWPPKSHTVLFDDLSIRGAKSGLLPIDVVSEDPGQEASRLLRRFLRVAQREPMTEQEIGVYERLVLAELDAGKPLAESLIAGYSAFLSSGSFLFLSEPMHDQSNRQFAIAARLSHLLGNNSPDEALMELASNGKLLEPGVLRHEVARLIANDSFDHFVRNFTDYWLSLKDIRRDEPDARRYPEYRFDDYLIESMEAETRAYVLEMVRENLPIAALIDSDFAYVNDRLSKHYGLPPVTGSRMRKVQLPASSPYGGLITQAAVMKVTSNGTTTSPVLRGVWMMERILGDPPPPPPPDVPAVEPDIRGASSIRELLALHTQDSACARCHARFDPIGFALENFDIMGAWRDRYRSLESGDKVTGIDRAGHAFAYHLAGPVDAHGKLPDGRQFQQIADLRQLLLTETRQLARSFLGQLTVYSTGTPVRFSDRPVIESILDRCQPDGYRTQDLILELVQSRLFVGIEKSNRSNHEDNHSEAGRR